MKSWVIFLLQPTDPDISRIQSLSSAQLTWPAVHIVHSSLKAWIKGLFVLGWLISEVDHTLSQTAASDSVWGTVIASFYSTLFAPAGTLCDHVVCVCVFCLPGWVVCVCVCSVSTVWQESPALGCLQRPHWGCAYPAQSRLRPGHSRWREYIQLSVRRVAHVSTCHPLPAPDRWITFHFAFFWNVFFLPTPFSFLTQR